MKTADLLGRKVLLLVGDVVLLYVSLALTLLLRHGRGFTPELYTQHLGAFTLLYAVWLVAFYIGELYELDFGAGRMALASKIARGLAAAGALAVVVFYFGAGNWFELRPQRLLLIHLAVTAVLLFLWRRAFSQFAAAPHLANNVCVIGRTPLTDKLLAELHRKPGLGYAVRALVPLNGDGAGEPPAGVTVGGRLDELRSLCERYAIDTIVSAVDPRQHPELVAGLFACLPLKVNFVELPSFYEKITGKIPVENIGHVWFLENLHESTKHAYELTKRLLDVVVSLAAAVVTLPLWPLIILAIRLDSAGPILFRQVRLGKGGKRFLAVKFRTMRADAETAGPQWSPDGDPRVTRVGRLLRSTRLDEIPQLLNVLVGEMSLIGPRPERPEFIASLRQQIPFYEERLLVKPGLTGWAQVSLAYGASVEYSLEKLQYDLFYIKNRTLWLDLSIALKTIKTILSGAGR